MDVYESIWVLDNNNKEVKELIKIENPSLEQKWFYAIKTENFSYIHKMLSQNIDIDLMDSFGNTIAHYAVELNSKSILEICFRNNANFLKKDIEDLSAWHLVTLAHTTTSTFEYFIDNYSFELSVMLMDKEENLLAMAKNDKNIEKIKSIVKWYENKGMTMLELNIFVQCLKEWLAISQNYKAKAIEQYLVNLK